MNIQVAMPMSTALTTMTTVLILPEEYIHSVNQSGAPDAAKVLIGKANMATTASSVLTIVCFIGNGL